MLIYSVFVSVCTEHVKGEEPNNDGTMFSFDRESLQVAIDKDMLNNNINCRLEYTGILEVMCYTDVRDKIKFQLKTNNCGWLFSDKHSELTFYPKPDPKQYLPVIEGDGIKGYIKRRIGY